MRITSSFLLAFAIATAGALIGVCAAADPKSEAEAAYEAALTKAQADYWNATLQAKQAYLGQLQADIKRAMQAGDLTAANQINAQRQALVDEIALMQAGEPITVKPPLPRVVAACGFNIKDGLGVHAKPGYKLDGAVPATVDDGADFGWAGNWQAGGDWFTVVTTKSEGDAGGKFTTTGEQFVWRGLKTELRGKILIEQSLMTDEKMNLLSRPGGPGAGSGNWGPNWQVDNNEFTVQNGKGDESHDGWIKTGIKVEPHVWYNVGLTIDTTTRTWEFSVNGKKFKTDKPLGFRSAPDCISAIDYLPSSTFYIDAIKVTLLEEAPPK